MSGGLEQPSDLTLRIEPIPTPDEEAAIVAALTVLGLRRRPVAAVMPAKRTEWREAGRREGLRRPVERWGAGVSRSAR